MENPTSALVFCRTRLEVDALVETLNAHGYRAEALHGGMEQRQRDRVMNRVPRGEGRPARRHRRRRARPRHRAPLARRQLRRARRRRRRTCTASAAPAAPDARAPRSRSPSRASTGCCAASSSFTQAEDRGRDGADRRRPARAAARADARVAPRAARSPATSTTCASSSSRWREEFDIVDIAAAAVKMAHQASGVDGEREEQRDRCACPSQAGPTRTRT